MNSRDDHTNKPTNGSNGSNGSALAGLESPPDPPDPSLESAPDGAPEAPPHVSPAPPAAIEELAEACVRFVERAIGVRLDYTLETLPLLDHYVEAARETLRGKKPGGDGPTLSIIAQAAGAYFGEVVRRRHVAWWRLDAQPEEHRLEFHHVYLVVRPVTLMLDALTLTNDDKAPSGLSGFELDEEDRAAAAARLSELPPVSLEEYVSPSTRLEVLDIVVDAVRAFQMAEGLSVQELEPDDYLDA